MNCTARLAGPSVYHEHGTGQELTIYTVDLIGWDTYWLGRVYAATAVDVPVQDLPFRTKK